MAPLAKINNEDVEAVRLPITSCAIEGCAVEAPPASVWSCAAPALIVPMTSLTASMNSSSHSTSTDSTGSSSSSSSASSVGMSGSMSGSSRKTTSLAVVHSVGCSFRSLFFMLLKIGVAKGSVTEMKSMILNEQYLEAMERATDCFECINATVVLVDLDSIVLLFSAAWESLVDYSRWLFKEARREYNQWENQQWVEFIEVQNMTNYNQERRKHRQLENLDPEEQKILKGKLFVAMRFKIDCEKSLVLITEWGRYLRVQKRRLQKQQEN